MAERDFLDKMVTKRTARNPAFPNAGRGATPVGATSQSFVARLESTASEARVSTASDLPGVSGAWCSITSFPWTRAPTSRPSSFMRAHRFQTASDLRFGPGAPGGR